MSIRVICLGKTKQNYIEEGVQEYQKRLNAFLPVQWDILKDISVSGQSSIDAVKSKEADIIRKALRPGEKLIALDEHGKQFTSPDFAYWLEGKIAHDSLAFVIGGVYGLDNTILQEADLCLSFSAFTFTHQMIRMLLAEQLYRACTILKGKEYHY